MKYDCKKYHIVTTLFNSEKRRYDLEHQPYFQNSSINYYYAYKTGILDKFLIIDNNRHIFDKNTCWYYEKKNSMWDKYMLEYTGWLGCVCGFLGAINIAKILNWPYLFVFEDDIILDKNFDTVVNIALQNSDNFLCVLLYYHQYRHPIEKYTKKNLYLYQIDNYVGDSGAAYLINSSYYDTLIDILTNKKEIQSRDSWYNFYQDNIYFLHTNSTRSGKIISLSKNSDISAIDKNDTEY